MFGKCIEKINNFIQWTKKSYFWHPLIASNLGFNLYDTARSIIKFGWDETWTFPGMATQHVSFIEGINGFLLFIFLTFIMSIPFAITISILAKVIYFILIKMFFIEKRPCCITNKFLLCNKWYNIYYTASFGLISVTLIIAFYYALQN